MSGVEAAQRIRAMYPKIRIFFLTGAVGEKDRLQMTEVSNGILYKPFTCMQLLEGIDNIMRDHPMYRERSYNESDEEETMSILLNNPVTSKFFPKGLDVRIAARIY
jgi:DNA-binding response OmpR family regulator